ncbi:1-pyrroline-5-carboxylate dehydrogenase [bioreactor metagenome]|uniref:L-glutamate gamma-semialdehyde dehydrogenase n=1 Tax=bioreactor metagenome TaxID=1076179 RepID=A0A644WNW4_9ZZZZ
MNNAIFDFENPQNETILNYSPGSSERILLTHELKNLDSARIEIPLIINGKEVTTGKLGKVVMPHDHGHVLASYHMATDKEVKMAIDAAMKAHESWAGTDWTIRAAILLKAAELLATKYRYLINAATMLGQSKNPYQAEIDSACEAIDFLRYNAYFASKIYSGQPKSGFNQLNKMEYRALEGFVFAVSPFNFTAIASNLNMSPVLMGNTTIWKPASTAIFSNYYLMKIFQEAGLPDGVINFLPGSGSLIGKEIFASKDLGGIHFTGSNATFNSLWRSISENLTNFKSYPRIVGETGGKGFVFVHPSASPLEVAVGIIRGAFEYQGQKCSAASRGYIPKSLWPEIKDLLIQMTKEISIGDVRDFKNFMNAVIDAAAFDSIMQYIDFVKNTTDAKIIAGGKGDKSKGFFIEPTIIETSNPKFKTMEEEIFGPVMTIYVYDDKDYDAALDLCESTSPYALTGAIFSKDRVAASKASQRLKNAAGNFYINDKPTGAMVGMQPFGGARASGTNDKAGGNLNLLRWTSPRTIKETFAPATDFHYPFMM